MCKKSLSFFEPAAIGLDSQSTTAEATLSDSFSLEPMAATKPAAYVPPPIFAPGAKNMTEFMPKLIPFLP